VTAGNLAVAFAQAGYKVVLVDAQFENPVLTTVFKAEKREGLVDLMMANSIEPQLLPVDQAPGIRFLPIGLSSEKSSHAMLNPTKLTALFEQLQKDADLVLVAGSAISRYAESLTLASQVNAVILVARRAEARSKVVSKVVENLRLMKINLAGVIFDYNAWPFSSVENRKTGSAVGRGISKEALTPSNISE
jgi:Mrp family chromosome partitioning ATPase